MGETDIDQHKINKHPVRRFIKTICNSLDKSQFVSVYHKLSPVHHLIPGPAKRHTIATFYSMLKYLISLVTDFQVRLTFSQLTYISCELIGSWFVLLADLFPTRIANVGCKLVCYPLRGKITRKHRIFFNTAERVLIPFGETNLRGYKWGQGPRRILLLHGWQSHTYLWKNYVKEFDQSIYTIYAFDAPGHGLTSGSYLTLTMYSEAIQKVIRHIGKADHVIAHSIGSFAALHTFYTQPPLTPSSMVLLSPPGQMIEFFRFFQTRFGLTKKCAELILSEYEKRTLQPITSFDAHVYAASIDIPGLIIHDEMDKEISFEHACYIQSQWRKSTLIATKGQGHMLSSREVVDNVAEFIINGTVQKEKIWPCLRTHNYDSPVTAIVAQPLED